MRTIYKYPIETATADFTLGLPSDAKVLTLQIQNEIPTLWVELDPKAEAEPRQFQICGTGHRIPDNANYIGTWQEREGLFVWHLYECAATRASSQEDK